MTDSTEAARALAARRKRAAFTCQECGTTFEAVVRKGKTAARYCSAVCLMRARRKVQRPV